MLGNPSTIDAPQLQGLVRVLHPYRPIKSPRLKSKIWSMNSTVENLEAKFDSIAVENLPRRLMLCIGLMPVLSYINLVHAAPAPDMAPDIIRTRKLPSGVRVQDIIEGEGQEAHEGDLVEFNYVCRRSNGYFVYSTVDQFNGEAAPVILPLDDKQMIKGLKDVLVGMKVGGKRKALIPPTLGYTNESLKPVPEEFGPRRSLLSHAGEPLVFEVQLLKVL